MNRQVKATGSDRIFYIFNYLFLTFAWIAVMYPLLNVISNSFSSASAVGQGRVYVFPVEPSVQAYRAVFRNKWLLVGYANTIFYATVGTAINIIVTVLAAYPLSIKRMPLRGFFTFFFTFTMLFGGGLIPTYLVIRSLGMIDTRWAMIIPNAMGVWYVIIARTFFQTTIPDELREAAEIDGATDTQFIIRVVMPLSVPVLVVLALFYAVEHWNSYQNALFYLTSIEKFNLQLIIRSILRSAEDLMNQVESGGGDLAAAMRRADFLEVVKYATIVVSVVPVIIAYPFAQRYFIKGIMIGSLKG